MHRSDQMLSSEDSSDEESMEFGDSRQYAAAEEGSSEAESDADDGGGNNGAQEQHLQGVLHPHEEHPPQSAEAFEHPESADPAALAGHPEGAQPGQSIADGAPLLNGCRGTCRSPVSQHICVH